MRKIYDQAQKVLELMLEAAVPPTPSNYEFWYHYVTKSDPRLVVAIDDLRHKNQPIHAQTMSKLRQAFFGNPETDNIDTIVDKTTIEIDKLLGMVENAGGDARIFHSALQDGKNILDRAVSAAEKNVLFEHIASAAAAMTEPT